VDLLVIPALKTTPKNMWYSTNPSFTNLPCQIM
jgi:hypothetical protein